jgi:hypothetical protein
MDHFFVANMEQYHTITVIKQVEDADMYVPWSFDVHQLDVELTEEAEDSIEFEHEEAEVAFEVTKTTKNEQICSSENHSICSDGSSVVLLCRLCTKVLRGVKHLSNSQEATNMFIVWEL